MPYLVKIQRALRRYLEAKHGSLDVPENLCCPITLQCYRQPVVAADGNTYELEAIKRVLDKQRSFPVKGPLGVLIPCGNLVPNRAVIDLCNEFRERHRMAPMYPFTVQHFATNPSHPHTAPAPVQVPQPPQRAPARPQPMQLRDVFNMGLARLVQQPAFLWELKKPALSMSYNRLQSRQTTRKYIQHGRICHENSGCVCKWCRS